MNVSYKKALDRIKAIVDAYNNQTIHITIGNDDFDAESHAYDVSAIMGIIGNHINDAFRDNENLKKGDQNDEGFESISEL